MVSYESNCVISIIVQLQSTLHAFNTHENILNCLNNYYTDLVMIAIYFDEAMSRGNQLNWTIW